jgi:hypothetical protein
MAHKQPGRPVIVAGGVAETQVTRGQSTRVDAVDADLLADSRWQCSIEGYAVRYVRCAPKPRQKLALHRLVLERAIGRQLFEYEQADHINGDRLDNRRSNLRTASITQNRQNRARPKNNTSGVKGVFWMAGKNEWYAYISVNGKRKALGRYSTKEEAAARRAQAEQQHYGQFAREQAWQ